MLALAALVVLAPLLHSHPLDSEDAARGISNPSVCAICAVAAQQITVIRSVIPAPAIVADHVVTLTPHHRSVDVALPLASRAPPQA